MVHKDIKSSNIKIANFGLVKLGCNAITMHTVGTQGYIALEYLSDGAMFMRMDLFSFGVVLLKLVLGREAMDEEGRAAVAKAFWGAQQRGDREGQEAEPFGGGSSEEIGKAKRLRGWMDKGMVANTLCSVESVAFLCLNRDASRSPSMVDIVYALCKSDDIFDLSEDGLSADDQVLAR
ncbi:hypothetical protein NL676_021054 [Syzygium grande]|nr:hypothetical protein NL676_021054 [Syzygium grande]